MGGLGRLRLLGRLLPTPSLVGCGPGNGPTGLAGPGGLCWAASMFKLMFFRGGSGVVRGSRV